MEFVRAGYQNIQCPWS